MGGVGKERRGMLKCIKSQANHKIRVLVFF